MRKADSYRDQTSRCKGCGTEFLFTATEQRLLVQLGEGNEVPTQCPGCRALEQLVADCESREQADMGLETGRIKWFDRRKGFGFLVAEGGEQFFFHRSSLPRGRRAARSGQVVQFARKEGRRGLEAVHLRVVGRHDEPGSMSERGQQMGEAELHES